MASSLKPALVLSKTKCTSLGDVRSLNLWGCGLSDVSLLERMPSLEVVSMSLNALTTLRAFAHLPALQELYLRKNCIVDAAEVVYLQGLRNLHTLWLSDNPCADESPGNRGAGGAEEGRWYRTFVLRMLPQLRKLDRGRESQMRELRSLPRLSLLLRPAESRSRICARRRWTGRRARRCARAASISF